MFDINLLLKKYLDNKCTVEEKKELFQYLLESKVEDHEHVLNALWVELQNIGFNNNELLLYDDPIDPEVFARMKKNINRHINKPQHVSTIYRSGIFKIAASFVLVACAAFFYYYLYSSGIISKIHTAFGEVKTVNLPDGSVVNLTPNSDLSYSTSLKTDAVREVWLKGEAYFRVTHKVSNHAPNGVKLIVHTNEINIEVVGTSFNVKNRRGVTNVALDEGKIRLRYIRKKEELFIVNPGEAVKVTKNHIITLDKNPLTLKGSFWTGNELHFDDQSLLEIKNVLADNYNITLNITDPALENLRFTGSTPINDLSILFSALEKSFSLTIVENNKNNYTTKKIVAN